MRNKMKVKTRSSPMSIVLLLLISFSFFSFSLVEAKPDKLISITDVGYIIETGIIEDIKQGQDFTFHAHVHNASTGQIVPTSDLDYCMIHIYNTLTGKHMIADNMSIDDAYDMEYLVLGNNFTTIGQSAVYMYCEKDGHGGFLEYPIFVTPEGFSSTLGFYFLILLLSFGIVILGLSLSDATITILGSFGLYFISLYMLFNGIAGMKDPVYTWGISIVILAVAMYVSVKSAMELLGE